MKKFFLILFLIVSGGQSAYAAGLPITNAGFVPANIWYSKDPFFADETIRVYTIIFNGSKYDLMGGVEFLDNGTTIGKTKFSLSGGGRVQDVWVDWKATQGAHIITARLVNVIADGPNGKQPASLNNIETGKSERVVDLDPAIIEAQSKAQEQKINDAKNQAIEKIGGVADTVTGYIPLPIKKNVSIGTNAIEKFRIDEAYQFQVARESKMKDIDALKAASTTRALSLQKSGDVLDSIGNAAKEPFAYVVYAFFALLQYLFQWQILFYGVILYAIYRLIKWIARKIRDRNDR